MGFYRILEEYTMTKFRRGAFTTAAALTTIFAGNAFAIDSKAACEYEGGETFNINGDLICVVPLRGEEFHGEEYDDAQLGVKECQGDLIGDDLFCRITIKKGPKKPVVEITQAPEDAMKDVKADMKKDGEKAMKDAADKAEDTAKEAIN